MAEVVDNNGVASMLVVVVVSSSDEEGVADDIKGGRSDCEKSSEIGGKGLEKKKPNRRWDFFN